MTGSSSHPRTEESGGSWRKVERPGHLESGSELKQHPISPERSAASAQTYLGDYWTVKVAWASSPWRTGPTPKTFETPSLKISAVLEQSRFIGTTIFKGRAMGWKPMLPGCPSWSQSKVSGSMNGFTAA